MAKVTIIAEAGVNHNGDINLALQLIDVAADAGADYVKFQTFRAEELVSKEAQLARYQAQNMGSSESDSQFEMLKKLELSAADHHTLLAHCEKKGIKFLSTAFDLASIDLLLSLGIDLFKIPSGEVTNLPYLKKIGGLGTQIILSTGMCTLDEIGAAINALVQSGAKKEQITVLHCTTDYPTKMADVNLQAMLEIQKKISVNIGYSDHTQGIEVAVAATALGATVIEKHFTISRELPGPDHKASLEPQELKQLVQSVRNIEQALGNGHKGPTDTEKANRLIARKSIHLQKAVAAGHIISAEDLTMLRPGSGISPMQMDEIVGKKLRTAKDAFHMLSWEDFA